MQIVFQTPKLKKVFNERKSLDQTYGSDMANRISKHLVRLRDAANVEEFRTLPQGRCHELKGDRAGQLALDLVHPHRLIFEPANTPLPTKSDGGLDWQQVTSIRIIEVDDYH